MTNLLFIISRFLDGGIDTVLVEYLRNLPPDRFDITLAVAVDMGELEVHAPRLPENVKVVHLAGPRLSAPKRRKVQGVLSAPEKVADEVLLNPLRRGLAARRLRRLAEKADAVVDFDMANYTLLKGIGKPVIGFYHFSPVYNLEHDRRHTSRQLEAMRGYDRVVLLCDAMVREAESLLPDLKGRFVRIYNGLNLPALEERSRRPFPEGIPADVPYFLQVARLEESQKDTSTLLRAYAWAAARLRDAGAPVPELWLVGKGRDERRLRALAEELGVASRVRFLGFVAEPAPLMAGAVAVVLSSRYEGLPTVLLEAQGLGVPTIAADCPVGPAEILKDGEAGWLFPPGNVADLAVMLHDVALHDAMRSGLAEVARSNGRRFDIKLSVEALEKVVAEVSGKHSDPLGRPRIAAVLNTFRAERYLGRVLEALREFDEIVVCDMMSDDATVEIARRFGANIVSTERRSFCEPARNLAIRSASCEWVLVVDADELVPDALREYLYGLATAPDAPAGLRIPRRNFFMGREMHCLYPDYVLRFMRREAVDWPPTIHSTPVVAGRVDSIPAARRDLALVHLEENTVESRLEKIGRYTDFEVERRGPRLYSPLQKALKPAGRFFRSFLLKGGFRDGAAGLQWAKLEARYKRETIRKQEQAARAPGAGGPAKSSREP